MDVRIKFKISSKSMYDRYDSNLKISLLAFPPIIKLEYLGYLFT